MKKIIGAITAAICALCTISIQSPISDISVSALSWSDELSYGNYLKYQKIDIDEDGTYDYIEIRDCDESATEIEIPGEIEGLKGTVISGFAFRSCDNLTSVKIPDTVTSISSGTFYGTKLLQNQTGVKYVDKWAVECDEDVTNVEIKEGTRGIADGLFSYCESLTSINIPDSVKIIGYGAFKNCTSLTSISIPDSVTEIDEFTFDGCTNLTSVDIPNSVTSIGSRAFKSCTNLKSITIPNSATDIGFMAFYDSGLIENQDGVEYVGEWLVGCDENVKNVEIKAGTKGIAEDVFYRHENLTKITMPNDLKIIGGGAFASCSNLENVIISDSVTEIRYNTFISCESLKNVTIPNSVTKIGYKAFAGCKNLTSIDIPDSVTSIDDYAFMGCTNLESITIENPECVIYDKKSTISNICDFANDKISFDGTIYGYENSTAQAYAEKYGYKFEALEPENEIVPGDITGNGKIDLYDAIDICKYIMGMKTFTEEEMKIADFDGNGKVDLYDVIGIAKTLLG